MGKHRSGKIYIAESIEAGRFQIHLDAANGAPVSLGHNSDGYGTKASAKRGLEKLLELIRDEELFVGELKNGIVMPLE